MTEEIYCKHCKYFSIELCFHPSLQKKNYRGNRVPIPASEINHNKNCKLFENGTWLDRALVR